MLDDDVRRHGGFAKALLGHKVLHVYDYNKCIAALGREVFDIVYLDHDLNDFGRRSTAGPLNGKFTPVGRELTGVDVATFIVQLSPDKRPKKIVIHTWNPDGGRAMLMNLLDAGVDAVYEPYQAPVCGVCGKGLEHHKGNNRQTMTCPDSMGGPV